MPSSADQLIFRRQTKPKPVTAGTGSVRLTQSEEDTIGEMLQVVFSKFFLDRFWTFFLVEQHFCGVKEGRQVGRLVGVELGL